jgi:hypothetical protein
MDEQMKSRLTSGDVWVRGLYLILFAIAWGLSEVLLTFTVIFQFLTVLFTGSANEPLLRFGQNLSRYHYQIGRFVSFNTEDRPFPFSDWPDDEPRGERWRDEVSAESGSVEEAVPADAADPGTEKVAPAAEDASDPAGGLPEEDVSASRKDGSPPPA